MPEFHKLSCGVLTVTCLAAMATAGEAAKPAAGKHGAKGSGAAAKKVSVSTITAAKA